MAISMTEAAARHIRRSLDGRGKGEGIRLGVRTTGCSGLAYVLEFVDEVGEDDQVFETYGCGSAIASSSLATEWMKGKTLDEAETIKNTQLAEELALPPVKIHCSVLAEDAIKAAVRDYKQKKGLI